MNSNHLSLSRLVGLIDLTDLSNHTSDIKHRLITLCKSAQTPFGSVAAVCVYADNIPTIQQHLADSIQIATVANFPHGNLPIEQVRQEILNCLQLGANEIDVVLPYAHLKAQDLVTVNHFLRECRTLTQGHCLKVIIESGLLTEEEIRIATAMICEVEADFVKTSTGKIAGKGASIDAVRAILSVLTQRQQEGKFLSGIKISGGVNRDNVYAYLDLIDHHLGADWISPKTVRIGASALLNELVLADRP